MTPATNAESALQPRWRIELVSEVNRAFSAGGFLCFTNPGALPQARHETAPLALNRCILSVPENCRQDCLHHDQSSVKLLSSSNLNVVPKRSPRSFRRLQSHLASTAAAHPNRNHRICIGTNRALINLPLLGSSSSKYINAKSPRNASSPHLISSSEPGFSNRMCRRVFRRDKRLERRAA